MAPTVIPAESLSFSKVSHVHGVVLKAEKGAAIISRRAVTSGGHWIWHTAPPVIGLLAVISLWDHHIEKERIAREYEDEIGASLVKPADKVTIDDMEKVAKENPVIGEALNRSTKRRNLSVGVMIVGTIAAFALAGVLLQALPLMAAAQGIVGGLHLGGAAAAVLGALHIGGGVTAVGATKFIAHMLVSGIGAGLTFFGIEKHLEKYGEKKLGLEEPGFHKVERNPALQPELSVPSQITLLKKMQKKGKYISREQVMTVFVSTDAQLAEQIESRFGLPFAELPAHLKTEAVRECGGQYIADLTQDINDRNLRVQELAFAAYRQSSGVKNPAVQKRVAKLGTQLNQLYTQPKRVRSAPAVQTIPDETTMWRQKIRAEQQAVRQKRPLPTLPAPLTDGESIVWRQQAEQSKLSELDASGPS